MNALALESIERRESKATFERLGPEQAAHRFTHMPKELVATAACLASDDAGFETAASFPLDGGIPGAFTVSDVPPRLS